MTDLDHLLLQRRIDALLAPWQGTGGPGVTIGLVVDGALRVHRHAGLANVEHGVPIGADTRFRIASVSKQFTCAAILSLAADGALALDDLARTHLPELPAVAGDVTVAQLMTNTSGLRDMFEIMRAGGADLGTPVPPQALLDGIARQRSLNFEPGSRFLYSNTNFLLLGLLAERISGQGLGAMLDERIFGPLGMRDTRLTPDVALAIPRLATGYMRGEEGWTRAAHAFPLGGEGGLVSSVPDLALWADNWRTRRVGAAWLDGLTAPTPFTNGTANRYARGLVVRPYRGLETWSHGGLWPGFRTEFLTVPSLGLAAIAISNCGEADPNLLAHRALDAVLDGRPGVAPHPAPWPRAKLDRLEGRFIDDATDATLDIAVSSAGVATLTSYGIPVAAEATAEGWLATPRASSVFAVRPGPDGSIDVEQDAGTRGLWRRADPEAALPTDLTGRYRSEEMAAEWTLTALEDRSVAVARGPVATGPAWPLEPVEGDLFRIRTPGTLHRAWLDVRAIRDGGRVTALVASGGRAKRVRYERIG